MSYHEKTDKQGVIPQLLCFQFVNIIGFIADLFIKECRQIIYKLVDAIFITGIFLVAINQQEKAGI